MIGYLKGTVLEAGEGRAILQVGDSLSSSAVGYEVHLPQQPDYLNVISGQTVELQIYSHIREDAFDLYGFLTAEEKKIFLALISVSGIGPKSALGILSVASPSALIDALLSGDQTFLTDLPGIGKKTAERLILELKDKLARSAKKAGLAPMTGKSDASGKLFQDLKSALLGLGYREHEVTSLLHRLLAEQPEQPLPHLLKSALRELS